MSGSDSGGVRTTSIVGVRTTTAGYTLVNGTGNAVTFTTPNDGNIHAYTVAATKTVTSAETGGQITVTWTTNGLAQSSTLFAGGAGAGTTTAFVAVVADPNTAVSVFQASALTLGASKVFASIVGQ